MPKAKKQPMKKESAAVKAPADKPAAPAEPVDGLPRPKKGAQPPQLLRGMKDILPAEQKYWSFVRGKTEELAAAFNFERIDTPILEETALFVRGVGKQTDIVEKEMFAFQDQGGENMVLRPEVTAPIVRAYINHGMWNQPQPVKLYYYGPVFRHERPQAGRYRQFTQAGLEVIGDRHPVVDAHLMFAAYALFKELGIGDVVVHVNSIGDTVSREAYKTELVNYYRSKRSQICENCKKRLVRNPLRLLDCKEDGCVAVRSEAPQIVDFLNEESKNHFVRVLEYLDEMEVPYQLNPHLVRGLDYYSHTVFEIQPADDAENKTQSTMAAGGRYDGLIETLGGNPTPACGFSWGIERIILKLKEKNADVPDLPAPDVFLAQLGEPARRKMLALSNQLRAEHIKSGETFSKDALKAQLESANRLGVRFTLILGQKEVLDGTVLIRDMDSGIQEIVDFKKIIPELKKRLAQPPPPKPEKPKSAVPEGEKADAEDEQDLIPIEKEPEAEPPKQ
jgi:histidyl-tRNA synthetase